MPRVRLLPLLAAAVLLAAAAWHASGSVPARRAGCATGASRAEVEASFADIRARQAKGNAEEALLALRQRAERGPHPATASFLLGEAAYAAGAYGEAVRHYRKALEADPSLADRGAPFDAASLMLARADALRRGPWAGARTPDTPHMQYLLRRLAGGCE